MTDHEWYELYLKTMNRDTGEDYVRATVQQVEAWHQLEKQNQEWMHQLDQDDRYIEEVTHDYA